MKEYPTRPVMVQNDDGPNYCPTEWVFFQGNMGNRPSWGTGYLVSYDITTRKFYQHNCAGGCELDGPYGLEERAAFAQLINYLTPWTLES